MLQYMMTASMNMNKSRKAQIRTSTRYSKTRDLRVQYSQIDRHLSEISNPFPSDLKIICVHMEKEVSFFNFGVNVRTLIPYDVVFRTFQIKLISSLNPVVTVPVMLLLLVLLLEQRDCTFFSIKRWHYLKMWSTWYHV